MTNLPNRWFNRSQPETLQNATILLYLNAGFAVLYGSVFSPLGFATALAQLAGGWGVANERRMGYRVAVGVAAIDVAYYVIVFLDQHQMPTILGFLFAVVLLALLLHERSRRYQKIWFK